PNRLPGGNDVEVESQRQPFEKAYGVSIPPKRGMHLSQMFEAMAEGHMKALYVLGENPAQSEADMERAIALLAGLDCMVVQDIFMRKPAAPATVSLPAAASWCESDGTVTSSERRIQRVRKALEPPPGARDDMEIIGELARRLGHDWGHPTAEEVWD